MNTPTQYAVCHLQKGSGNDSGMSCHIERRDANGKTYIPDNADASRTHLNRELIQFPEGVTTRTQAIDRRIKDANIKRKIGKNQVKAIRIILSGTHERMTEIEREGNLDKWIAANIRWLEDTFGKDNLVSCVLHMDEKTPHLHATVVPIVTTQRERREREGAKKYNVEVSARLCADEVMARGRLFQYQNTYAEAMRPFGLQRGIVGSSAKHQSNQKFYRDQMQELEENIAKLQEEVEATKEGRSRVLSWLGRGELAATKKKLSEKETQIKDEREQHDRDIAELEKEIDRLKAQLAEVEKAKKDELAKMRNRYKKEIADAVSRAEQAEAKAKAKFDKATSDLRTRADSAERRVRELESMVAERDKRIDELDRIANPHRYCLSSGAELVHHFIPNILNPSLHIWTKVGNVEYDVNKYSVDYNLARAYADGKITIFELVNAVFPPKEQVNELQASLLGIAFEALSGGHTTPHVGTGSGGETGTGLRWDGKRPDDFKSGGSRKKR